MRTSGAVAVTDQLLEIRAQDPDPAPDAYCRELPIVNLVAHRLLVELQRVGDLSDGHELLDGEIEPSARH